MRDSAIRSTDIHVSDIEQALNVPPISLRVRDVAALWGVGERYVWGLVLAEPPVLPSFRLGSRRLVRYEDAKAYIDDIAQEERSLRERLAEAS